MNEDNMSDSQTILIPADPSYVPNNCIIKKIQELYSANLEIHDQVQFIDCGENLEQILCPYCQKDLAEWWGDAMNAAYSPESGFSMLAVTLPCCGKKSFLNELDYNWPVGFSRTSLTFDSDKDLPHTEKLLAALRLLSEIEWRVIKRRI